MKKKKMLLPLAGFAVLVILAVSQFLSKPDPITVTLQGVLPEMSFDQRIYASEIILIGEIETVLPSKWNTLEKVNTKSLSSSDVHNLHFGMFTDVIVKPLQFLKGSLPGNSVLRVRSFAGQIEQVRFSNEMEPAYQKGQVYLFLLRQYWGTVKDYIDPGFYLPVNAYEGIYYIENETATSVVEKWALNDLISYIEESRWALTEPNIPEGSETQEIIEFLNSVYDIEAKAGYDFDTSNLESVFRNDPQFLVLPEKLEYTRYFNNEQPLDTPGYLDYKIAYYHWWPEGIEQNRNSEWQKKWGSASGANLSPIRERPIRIDSIEFSEGYVTVYLYDGYYRLAELYLTKTEDNWYIVGEKGITTKPGVLPADAIVIETTIPVTETLIFTETPTLAPVPAEEINTQAPIPSETPTVTP